MDEVQPDVAIHEAGHQVVAEALNLPVAETHLSPDGNSGFVRFDEALLDHLRGTQSGDEERWPSAVTSAAGAVAECIASGVPSEEGRHRLSDVDLRALEDFAEWREDGTLDLTPAVERAEAEAREILESRWSRVVGVAEKLREGVREYS